MIDLETFAELLFEVKVFRNGVVVIQGALDGEAQFVELERFLQIIVGAFFHRLKSGLDGAEPGDDNDDGWRVEGARFLKNLKTVGPGFVEVKIADYQFRLDCFNSFDGGWIVVERENLVPFGTQKFGDHLHHGDLVVNNQHFGHEAESKGDLGDGARFFRARTPVSGSFPVAGLWEATDLFGVAIGPFYKGRFL